MKLEVGWMKLIKWLCIVNKVSTSRVNGIKTFDELESQDQSF